MMILSQWWGTMIKYWKLNNTLTAYLKNSIGLILCNKNILMEKALIPTQNQETSSPNRKFKIDILNWESARIPEKQIGPYQPWKTLRIKKLTWTLIREGINADSKPGEPQFSISILYVQYILDN